MAIAPSLQISGILPSANDNNSPPASIEEFNAMYNEEMGIKLDSESKLPYVFDQERFKNAVKREELLNTPIDFIWRKEMVFWFSFIVANARKTIF